jgi:hypothetical protein
VDPQHICRDGDILTFCFTLLKSQISLINIISFVEISNVLLSHSDQITSQDLALVIDSNSAKVPSLLADYHRPI